MDNNQAQQSLAQARAAYAASSRPPVPVGISLISALAAGAGVALVGQSPGPSWLRMALLGGGVVLMAVAFLLPAAYRARQGLHGFRGQVRADNVVFGICALSLVVTGLNANSTLSAIYIGIGIVVAIVCFLLLRGKWARGNSGSAT